MATTWHPRMEQSEQKWLLTNGQVLTSPALEETPSGRKVRIIGTAISGYSRDVEDVIRNGINAKAQELGTEAWMMIESRYQKMEARLVEQVSNLADLATPKLHILDRNVQAGETSLWWKFEHEDFPLAAFVNIIMSTSRYTDSNGRHRITGRVRIVFPDTRTPQWRGSNFQVCLETSPQWNDFQQQMRYGLTHDQREKLLEFFRDVSEEVDETQGLMGIADADFDSEFKAAKWLLAAVRKVEAMSNLTIPDLRKIDAPTFINLPLRQTNINNEFAANLQEYLDNLPRLDQAVEYYGKVVEALRQVGVVVDGLDASDMARVLGSGEAVTMDIHPCLEGTTMMDSEHIIRVNLAVGTFSVVCDHKMDDSYSAAWQEAITIASLTGQEDELLAYARAKTRQVQSANFDTNMAYRLGNS